MGRIGGASFGGLVVVCGLEIFTIGQFLLLFVTSPKAGGHQIPQVCLPNVEENKAGGGDCS